MGKGSGTCNQRPQLAAVEAVKPEGGPPSMKVDHPSDHPLHKYQYSKVTLESESPPTLVFNYKFSDSASPTRYVKKDGKWEFDVGSWGLESGLSFDDMAGGDFVKTVSAMTGEAQSTTLPKSEGLAMREIYHQLLKTKESAPVKVFHQEESLDDLNHSDMIKKLLSDYKRVTFMLPTEKDKLSVRASTKNKTFQGETDSIGEIINSDFSGAQALTDSLDKLSARCNKKKAGYKLTIASRKGEPVYELSMRLAVVAKISKQNSEVGIFKQQAGDLGKLLSRAQEKLDTPNHVLAKKGKQIYPNPNFFNKDGTVLGGTPIVMGEVDGPLVAVDLVKLSNLNKVSWGGHQPVPSPTHWEVNPETGQADLSKPIPNQFWQPEKS